MSREPPYSFRKVNGANENVEYLSVGLTEETPPSSSSSGETVIENPGVCINNKSVEGDSGIVSETGQQMLDDLGKYEKEATNKILTIQNQVEKLREEILNLDKEVLKSQFKKYEDIFIHKIIHLDKIDTKGLEKIKENRKAVINYVQECLNILDSKTEGSVQRSVGLSNNEYKMPYTGFKDICATLLYCAEKFEEEMKINLNELNNIVFGGEMSETKMSLEKAKDYHYKEILASIGEIFKHIKLILYHDKKIRWLSDEDHFTKEELKRYSNVQNSQSCMDLSKSPDEERTFLNMKREKRRVASEISIGTLEAWERYLDQKKDDMEPTQEPTLDKNVISNVQKRTNPDFKKRRKYISSTGFGILEDDCRITPLNQIPEVLTPNLKDYEKNYSFEEINQSLLGLDNFEDRVSSFNNYNETGDSNNNNVQLMCDVEINDSITDAVEENDIKHKIDKTNNSNVQVLKPRIVDVMYKKKPT